jgi:ankyrin repeat protein
MMQQDRILNETTGADNIFMQRIAMGMAIDAGNAEAVRRLLPMVGGLEYADAKVLHIAAEKGHAEICQLLIDAGATVNATTALKETPLHKAVAWPAVCKVLAAAGGDLNARAWSAGVAPIHFAAAGGHVETVRLFLDMGMSVDARTDWRATPLHFAAERGQENVCRELIAMGADRNASNRFGQTALGAAGTPGACAVLVELGADPEYICDGVESKKLNALQWAIKNGRPEVIRYFAENLGADLGQRTAAGRTLLQLATAPEIKQFLQSLKTELAIAGSSRLEVGASRSRAAPTAL